MLVSDSANNSENLYNSLFCRLCAEKNSNGINLFKIDETGEDISLLINRYLPIKVNY